MIKELHMEYTEFLRQMERILEMEENSLNGTEALRDLPGWDSLAVLGLQAWVDASFSSPLDIPALASATTLEDVWRLIAK